MSLRASTAAGYLTSKPVNSQKSPASAAKARQTGPTVARDTSIRLKQAAAAGPCRPSNLPRTTSAGARQDAPRDQGRSRPPVHKSPGERSIYCHDHRMHPSGWHSSKLASLKRIQSSRLRLTHSAPVQHFCFAHELRREPGRVTQGGPEQAAAHTVRKLLLWPKPGAYGRPRAPV